MCPIFTEQIEKIYRGAYTYFEGDRIYSEEEFEIFKDNKEMTTQFISMSHSRVSTGELLTVRVDFTVNRNWGVKVARVEKNLGKKSVTEEYHFNTATNILSYQLNNGEEVKETSISTPPRFHLSLPATCCSFLFLLSKKFDSNASKNNYVLYSSMNDWSYVKELQTTNIALQRVENAPEFLHIGEAKLKGDFYQMFEDKSGSGGKKEQFVPKLKAFISKHIAIPYLLEDSTGHKIQIKYLNDLNG